MENIRKKLIILFLIVIAVVIAILACTSFKKIKEVNNIIELENCKEGDYIKLKVSRAYGTDYWYEEEGEKVARFIDIEMNGKALIALVEKEEAERILQNKNEEIYIEGVLQTFKEEQMANAYESIKQNYLEDFSGELTEEEILNLFTPLQLLCYEI